MATRIGLEPTTPSVTGWCSNQLSYRAMIAQVRGIDRGNVAYYTGRQAPCQAPFSENRKFSSESVSLCVFRPASVRFFAQNTKRPELFGSSRRYGRGSKFRTHGTRFWRPLLYQLSYTPMWSCYPDSNWRPHPYQGCALPTEL